MVCTFGNNYTVSDETIILFDFFNPKIEKCVYRITGHFLVSGNKQLIILKEREYEQNFYHVIFLAASN